MRRRGGDVGVVLSWGNAAATTFPSVYPTRGERGRNPNKQNRQRQTANCQRSQTICSFLKFVVVNGGTRPQHSNGQWSIANGQWSMKKRGVRGRKLFLPCSNSLLLMGERGRETQMVNGQ
ncbi:MAG: hypothetical protein KA314_27115 [Chloroflexi bacterium]|nr:hypothetical protein [Chloroflexota bacterium]